jgi:hypothetical protein
MVGISAPAPASSGLVPEGYKSTGYTNEKGEKNQFTNGQKTVTFNADGSIYVDAIKTSDPTSGGRTNYAADGSHIDHSGNAGHKGSRLDTNFTDGAAAYKAGSILAGEKL